MTSIHLRSLSLSAARALLVAALLPTSIAVLVTGCAATASPDDEPTVGEATSALAQGAQGPGGATPAQPAPGGATTAPIVQIFDGQPLTETRARAIVDRAGYKYVGFSRCAPASTSCAMFHVEEKGKDGRPLLFQVGAAHASCRFQMGGTAPLDPVHAGDVQFARRAQGSGGQAARTGQAGTGAPSTTPTPTTGIPTISNEIADHCFADHPVFLRGVFDGSSSFMPGYASTRLAVTYQKIQNDRWRNLYTVVTGTNEQPWNSGLEQSHYYEIRDGLGNLLTSDIDTINLIASSSGATESVAERCVRVGVGAGKLQEKAQALVAAICPAFLPEITLGVEGNGLTAGATIDLCSIQQATLEVVDDALVPGLAAACDAAPGCFLHDEGSCVPQNLVLPALVPYFAEWMSSGATGTFGSGGGLNCPNRRVTTVGVGADCEETTTEECDEINGQCYCEVVDAVQTCGGT